jgi:AhpD family alkylhydroperoxidase
MSASPVKDNLNQSRTALHQIDSLDPENPPLDEISFEPCLLDLIRLRVAILFNCQLCMGTHADALRTAGDMEIRIRQLDWWAESPLYDNRERSALALADALATKPTGRVPSEVIREARMHFNDAEVLQLVLTIFAASDWNYESKALDRRGMILFDKRRVREVP